MASVFQDLDKRGLIKPPPFVANVTVLEVVTGSIAYGMATDYSDFDVVGVCVPPQTLVFPHLGGYIDGFGVQQQRFDQYQQHHVFDKDAQGGRGRNYDLTCYSVVRYLHLSMIDANPNMVDTLFTPIDCVLHITNVGSIIREARKLALHKKCWPKFKGYAYSQIAKIRSKTPEEGSRRAEYIEKFGYDVKFASHAVRLLCEVEQILTTGDLDLRRDADYLKAIRAGEFTEDEIVQRCKEKEAALERAYEESKLPHGPDQNAIKKVLLSCLEETYGSMAAAIVVPDRAERALAEIAAIVEKYQARVAA